MFDGNMPPYSEQPRIRLLELLQVADWIDLSLVSLGCTGIASDPTTWRVHAE